MFLYGRVELILVNFSLVHSANLRKQLILQNKNEVLIAFSILSLSRQTNIICFFSRDSNYYRRLTSILFCAMKL